MDSRVTDTSGFYRLEADGTLFAFPDDVYGPGFELLRDLHEGYTYPVEGITWFDSRAEARVALLGPGAAATIDPLAWQAAVEAVEQATGDPQQLQVAVLALAAALSPLVPFA
jgi:hypothetical protein